MKEILEILSKEYSEFYTNITPTSDEQPPVYTIICKKEVKEKLEEVVKDWVNSHDNIMYYAHYPVISGIGILRFTTPEIYK